MRTARTGLAGLACAALVVACVTAEISPIPPTTETVADQLARGAPLYAQNCATSKCHGTQGEGLRSSNSFRAWPLVGPEFEARNPNAQVIFDVVRSGSEQNLRVMTDQQIYDAIAYELSQNGLRLIAPLTADNAMGIATSASGSGSTVGELFPPPGDATLVDAPFSLIDTGTGGYGGYLSWRVDQLAVASHIGSAAPSNGGRFLILVIAFANQSAESLDVGPEFLRIFDSNGNVLEPQALDLAYPIERFHHQTIEPGHGTAAVVIFALGAGATPKQLTYDDQTGHPLHLALTP